MRKKINKNDEFNHFKDLSGEWWDPNGKFKSLHQITPVRLKYITENIGLINKKNSNYDKILNGIKILDLGCGGGLVSEPLAKLGAEVTGIDFIKQNISIAKNHLKNSNLKIDYQHQDLLSIKLNKQYDIILMLELIEHLNNWQNVVLKIFKYLKPNGKIIFSTINRTLKSKIFAIFLAEQILKWVPKNTHKFNMLVKPKELKFFIENNDMKILDITGLVYNPIDREWILNKKMINVNYFCTVQKTN